MLRVVPLNLRARRTRAIRKRRTLTFRRARTSLSGVCAMLGTYAVRVGALAYLVAKTVAQAGMPQHGLLLTGADPEPPRPRANGLVDVVDQASWESFPASDPPGY